MRQTFLHGLAVVASLTMLSPALAQQTQYGSWDQTNPSSQTIMGRVGYPLTRGNTDDTNPTPAVEWTPGSIVQDAAVGAGVAPADNEATDVPKPGGGYEYQDAMNGCWNGEGCAVPRGANWVAGVNGLIFFRDYEDDRNLSYSTVMPTDNLFSTDADQDAIGGVEAFISRRNCNGRGWEIRYWGLFPGNSDVSLAGSPYTLLSGLNNLDHIPSGFNALQIYNAADSHRIYRNNEFTNVEFNLLRNAGANCGRSWEWSAGVRWFQFNEDFRYLTSTTAGAYPAALAYDIATDNDLVGFQLGGRSEICLNRRWSLNLGVKGGIYGNYINARQSFHDENDFHATANTGPYAGTDYEFGSDKTDTSFVGELDLGLIYQMSECWRARIGYRAVGLTGVALSVDQIPYDFSDFQNAARIKSNGSVLLNGIYVGVEHSF